jgi:hypothetical protein
MGEVQGHGYDPKTGRVWVTLFCIASVSRPNDEASFTLVVPSKREYENHFVRVDSKNRDAGYETYFWADRLHCRVWAKYTGPVPFGGPRSWIRAIFYLDTQKVTGESKEFLESIDLQREKFVVELNDPNEREYPAEGGYPSPEEFSRLSE